MSEKACYTGLWRHYLVAALQNLVNFHEKSMPAGFQIEGKGADRVLVISWESVVAGLVPPEGSIEAEHPTLLALQVVAASPAFETICPILRGKLSAFVPLLQPSFPTVLTTHLVETRGRVTLGDLDRFQRIRLQLSRLLKARPKVRVAIRSDFEAFLAPHVVPNVHGVHAVHTRLVLSSLVDAAGPTQSALDALATTVCTVPAGARTTNAQEAGALLRRERFGVLVDANYVIIRHTGLAQDVLANGDAPPWLRARTNAETDPEMKRISAAEDLRDWLREHFKVAGHETSARVFKKTEALKSFVYSPDAFTVLYRASVSAFVTEDAKRTGVRVSRGETPPRRRRIKELAAPLPEGFENQIAGHKVLLCRKGDVVFINVDCLNNVDLRRLVGLPRRDFIAYDVAGKPCYRFRDVPTTLYVALSVLAAHLKRAPLAGHLFATYGKVEDWNRAVEIATQVKERARVKGIPFTFEEDAYLMAHGRRWKRKEFWAEILAKFPHHTEQRLRRRSAFVRYMARTYDVSAEQLHNVAWLDANVRGRNLRRWKYIYKAIKEFV